MPTLEEEQQLRKQLRDMLSQIGAIDAESLGRVDDLGKQLSFQSGIEYFRRILKLFQDLSEVNLDDVSHQVLAQLLQQAQNALTLFADIRSFSPAKLPNPTQQRNALITRARDGYDEYYRILAPISGYLIRMGTDFKALEQKAREHFDKMLKESAASQDNLNLTVLEAQAVLEKIKTAAAEAGVAQHSIHFQEEAARHRQGGRVWLIATIALGILGAFYSWWSFHYHLPASAPGQGDWWPHLTYFTSRLLILSVVFFGMAWAAKNFKSHKHNEVVNRHRQNALRTFETFVKATEGDKETKDAVLLQATKCIFDAQSSGYLGSESEQMPSSTIVEILTKGFVGRKAS
jgi:hypothetical protein